ncbi:PEP-CTERM sorting domain-containing protein [Armatimonas sp.]|uniref:PEP-CTERM sorting domain-containing protein n=1 Tax=Armatimonas sp. TaxID=1872638 RepID=UPI00286D27A8|nr:PEP-CTERM sorting domain-containing protein [Armatimonas sp.]
MKWISHGATLGALTLLSLASAQAQNLNPVRSGLFFGSGSSVNNAQPANQSYFVGLEEGSERRNYFVFNLAGISSPITGATLQLYNPIAPPDSNNGYFGDATETYELTSTTANPTSIQGGFGAGAPGLAVFNSLGTGTSFGTITASTASNGQTLNLTFNPAGLAALNSALGGLVAFGGRITTIVGPDDQFLFNAVDPTGGLPINNTPPVVLSLSTSGGGAAPEPGTMAFLLLGGTLVLTRRRSRDKK